MADTFGEIWNRVALHASAAPPLLCRQWTVDAYQELCGGNRFGFLRASTKLVTQAARTVSATVTKGSAVVVGVFQGSDLNRQIRVSNTGRPYTIIALNGPFTQATLEQVYTGESGTPTLQILDAFLWMPENFDGCYSLGNLTVQQPMPWWYTKEQLDFWDPKRIWSDSSARLVAAAGVWDGGGDMDGRTYYEWWPYVTATGEYDLAYYKLVEPLDEDTLVGSLVGRSHVLVDGALARAANYPGTKERPNPYFSPALALRLANNFELAKQAISVRDDDVVPGEQYNAVDWRWVQGLVPMDTRLLRSTDATLGDYYAGGPGAGYL
jgi:hypothetical protein